MYFFFQKARGAWAPLGPPLYSFLLKPFTSQGKKKKNVERSWAENDGKKKKKEKDERFGEGVTDPELEKKMRNIRTLRIGKMREKYKSKKD